MRSIRGWGTLVLVAATAVTVSSCGVFETADFRETRKIEIPHVAGSALAVRTENGEVSVATGPGPSVVIEADVFATTKERLAQAKITAVRDTKGGLALGIEWPDARKPAEGCAFHVTLPEANGVRVECSNGRVEVRGDAIVGIANLTTSNGDVRVDTHSESVIAHSSNGRVTVKGPHRTVDAESSNGDVEAAVLQGPAKIRTSNGRVTLSIGEAFQGPIDVETSNGTIEARGLEGRPGVTVERPSKKKARIVVGSGGEPSSVHSSNGDVEIERIGK